jgi:protoheme IX farnesyltransferase
MLSKKDDTGIFTASQTVLFCIFLCALAGVPLFFGDMKSFYGIGAGVVNVLLLGSSVVFLLERSRVSARRLFFASILYLPAMLLVFAFAI